MRIKLDRNDRRQVELLEATRRGRELYKAAMHLTHVWAEGSYPAIPALIDPGIEGPVSGLYLSDIIKWIELARIDNEAEILRIKREALLERASE